MPSKKTAARKPAVAKTNGATEVTEAKGGASDQEELERLRKRVEELEGRGKLGLVWRDIPEEVETRLIDELPVLIAEPKLNVEGGKPSDSPHILIEGDNLHALHILQATHLGAVDLIYIDPPYNTGNEFIYNDKLIDDQNPWRHSAWLSFMEKRLRLAKMLLSHDGVIFISIDNHEVARLLMLGDQIFGESNRIGFLPRQTKKGGKTTQGFQSNHDYVLGWANNKSGVRLSVPVQGSYPEVDEHVETRGPFNVKQTLDYDSLTYSKSMDYPLVFGGETYYAGGDKAAWEKRQGGDHGEFDWTWRWSQDLVDWGARNDFIVLKGKRRPRLYTKTYAEARIVDSGNGYAVERQERSMAPLSIALVSNEYSNDIAKKELTELLGAGKFEFPKPSTLIQFLIGLFRRDDLVVLDFFAGSGTTLQAVAALNQSDGGSRQCLLVTNNENDICRSVTIPRIEACLTGKWVTGKREPLPGSLIVFRTGFLKRFKSPDRLRAQIAKHTADLIAVKETAGRTLVRGAELVVFHGANKTIAVVPGQDADHLQLRQKAEKKVRDEDRRIAYVFTWSDQGVEDEVRDLWPGWEVQPLPYEMLAALRRIAPKPKPVEGGGPS